MNIGQILLADFHTKEKQSRMNWDQIEGKWKQFRGQAKQQWGNLTDNDLEQINGKRDELLGRLQQRYGMAREDAQKKVDEWLKTLDRTSQTDTSHQTAKGY